MNSSSVDGSDSPFTISKYVQVLIIIMYTIIIIIAVGGNAIVCYLVYAYKRMHTVPNYFIVNLACSDIMMAVFCIPFTSVVNLINYWPFGEAMCPVVLYIQIVAVILSAYTLVAMSIDRYIVIVHPFKPRITVRQTVFAIMGIWVLSLAIPLPTLLRARIIYYSNTSGQCLETWEGDTEKYVYGHMLVILHYFGPLMLLLFSYARIGYNVWAKNIQGNDRNKRKLQLAAAKKRMIRMMITVVIFYALCWLPLHTITLLGDHNPAIYNNKYTPIIWLFSHWLSMSNSCYNPLIYLWLSPKFRVGLQLAVERCRPRRHTQRSSDEEIYHKIHKLFPKLRLELQVIEHPDHRERRLSIHMHEVASNEFVLPRSIHSDT